MEKHALKRKRAVRFPPIKDDVLVLCFMFSVYSIFNVGPSVFMMFASRPESLDR